MDRGLLDPKMDFIFKKIFGSNENKNILISFLNATLKGKDEIVWVKIEGTDIEKSYLEDKFSRLDIKAVTNKKEQINIEIQLRNERNMAKRTLYYWSKMYEEQLLEGENYSKLNRTVCINLLNFNYLDNNRFHNKFRLLDTNTGYELTDVMEIHFIEIPKLTDNSDEKGMLAAWVEFLKNPESDKVKSLEDDIEEIKDAKKELIKISLDKDERKLYEMRKKAIHDKANALSSAMEEGLEKGREQGKILSAISILDIADDKTIAEKLELDIEVVKSLRAKN